MDNKIKVAGIFVGLTVWMSIISVGVYRFEHHTALEEMTMVYECSSELLTKKDIIRTAENQSRISALVKHKQQQKVFLLLGSFSLSL